MANSNNDRSTKPHDPTTIGRKFKRNSNQAKPEDIANVMLFLVNNISDFGMAAGFNTDSNLITGLAKETDFAKAT